MEIILRLNLKSNADLREAMAVSHKPCEFRQVVKILEKKFVPFHLGENVYHEELNGNTKDYEIEEVSYNLTLPPWLCQPVCRPDQQMFM